MKGYFYLFLLLGVLAIALSQTFIVSATTQQINYNSTVNPVALTNPTLFVKVLKYDPYPVSAGEWFNVWVMVENIGQNDAPDVRFELAPAYPFESSDNLIRNYGTIPGKVNAGKFSSTDNVNQVILKYRVRAVDNAPEGTSTLKFLSTIRASDSNAISTGTDLPIVIGKTKTDFDAVMQDSSTQGTSFAIANIGNIDATAVTLTLLPDDNLRVTGPRSSIVGNLASGDFTTVTYQMLPNMKLTNVTLQIDYTDSSGVRNSILKVIPVNIIGSGTYSINGAASGFNGTGGAAGASRRAAANSSTNLNGYLYLVIGLVIGAAGFFGLSKMREKKK